MGLNWSSRKLNNLITHGLNFSWQNFLSNVGNENLPTVTDADTEDSFYKY